MRNYEIKTYDYVDKKTGAHIVKAVTMYAGRPITAIAKCDPEDVFNLELGARIALKRLDLKIANKRVADMRNYVKYCQTNLDFLEVEAKRIKKARDKAEIFVFDRKHEIDELEKQLEELLASTDLE